MTTSSPNPADGDVQALIEHIEKWKSGETRNDSISDFNKFQRKIYELSLAALTAEPVYQFIVNNPDKDGYIEWADCNPDYFSKEPSDKRRTLYTAPSAQLLRPLELPTAYDIVERGPAYHTFRDLELDEDGAWLRKDEVIEALRQQGYEVKND